MNIELQIQIAYLAGWRQGLLQAERRLEQELAAMNATDAGKTATVPSPAPSKRHRRIPSSDAA
jgi:hypothetical protein